MSAHGFLHGGEVGEPAAEGALAQVLVDGDVGDPARPAKGSRVAIARAYGLEARASTPGSRRTAARSSA